MRFELEGSPFQNIHKYQDPRSLGTYFEARARSLLVSQRQKSSGALPPSAFLFGPTHGSYVNGFQCASPEVYFSMLRVEAQAVGATQAILMVEMTSATDRDYSLLVTEFQPSYYRLGYEVAHEGRHEITSDWTIPALTDDEKSLILELDPELDWDDPVIKNLANVSKNTQLFSVGDYFEKIIPPVG